ncbi:hypothetical protein D0T92_06225 [Neisseria zalophi]|uniref:Uncharacterized protein n=1 Tax=Neisseria zalophi TaxID=640030 RepID=A0A5J6PVA1_9NEIS|nr:hypothetical protein D0T92_06225 [Neisseria zalophi]
MLQIINQYFPIILITYLLIISYMCIYLNIISYNLIGKIKQIPDLHHMMGKPNVFYFVYQFPFYLDYKFLFFIIKNPCFLTLTYLTTKDNLLKIKIYSKILLYMHSIIPISLVLLCIYNIIKILL